MARPLGPGTAPCHRALSPGILAARAAATGGGEGVPAGISAGSRMCAKWSAVFITSYILVQ